MENDERVSKSQASTKGVVEEICDMDDRRLGQRIQLDSGDLALGCAARDSNNIFALLASSIPYHIKKTSEEKYQRAISSSFPPFYPWPHGRRT